MTDPRTEVPVEGEALDIRVGRLEVEVGALEREVERLREELRGLARFVEPTPEMSERD